MLTITVSRPTKPKSSGNGFGGVLFLRRKKCVLFRPARRLTGGGLTIPHVRAQNPA